MSTKFERVNGPRPFLYSLMRLHFPTLSNMCYNVFCCCLQLFNKIIVGNMMIIYVVVILYVQTRLISSTFPNKTFLRTTFLTILQYSKSMDAVPTTKEVKTIPVITNKLPGSGRWVFTDKARRKVPKCKRQQL